MPTTRHRFADLEGSLFIGGRTQFKSTGAVAIQISSTTGVTPPLAQNADVGIVRNSTGNYTLTINPFRGPLGGVVHAISAATGVAYATVADTTYAYTNDSLALTIRTSSGGTLVDADVSFIIIAF